ncbi:YceD family protein [Altererythrobacter sp. Root672]|uniref:YceD family protein n=1 Tax=Altererythrobacter sp. Root672 TaxID=1736584 RepID=UPI0006F511CC|nr:DUF177 domain-containing protein [Altererythrobacter sp. Root672]KRA81369.1 DNA-binding protein [Altererythrobacter sp. Root672]
MTAPEFSRPIDLRHFAEGAIELEANEEERKAVARRFLLVAIKSLKATLDLRADGQAINANGRLHASIVQSCAISGEDLPVTIDEPLIFRFVPETPVDEEELELDAGDLDEIAYSGQSIDLGEAVAQSLVLAIDPYATGPNADRFRKEAGLLDEAAAGPFGALAALKKQD